jgi:hypothetical protein
MHAAILLDAEAYQEPLKSDRSRKPVEKPRTTSSSLRDTPHTHQFRREGTPSQSPAAPSAAGEQQSAAMPGRCPSP